MKKIIPLILVLFVGNALAETYLCISDITTGAATNQNGDWEKTHFLSGDKWIIKMEGNDGFWYQHGSEVSKLEPNAIKRWYPCDRIGDNQIECKNVRMSLSINFRYSRFVYTEFFDYIVGLEKDPSYPSGTYFTNYVALGQCSQL